MAKPCCPGVDGRSDFNGLHSRKHNDEVQFYAFDMLALEGLRPAQAAAAHAQDQPRPAGGSSRRRQSDVEQGEIGPDLYRQSPLAPVKPALERAHEEQYQHDGRSYDQDHHVACHTLLRGLSHGNPP